MKISTNLCQRCAPVRALSACMSSWPPGAPLGPAWCAPLGTAGAACGARTAGASATRGSKMSHEAASGGAAGSESERGRSAGVSLGASATLDALERRETTACAMSSGRLLRSHQKGSTQSTAPQLLGSHTASHGHRFCRIPMLAAPQQHRVSHAPTWTARYNLAPSLSQGGAPDVHWPLNSGSEQARQEGRRVSSHAGKEGRGRQPGQLQHAPGAGPAPGRAAAAAGGARAVAAGAFPLTWAASPGWAAQARRCRWPAPHRCMLMKGSFCAKQRTPSCGHLALLH